MAVDRLINQGDNEMGMYGVLKRSVIVYSAGNALPQDIVVVDVRHGDGSPVPEINTSRIYEIVEVVADWDHFDPLNSWMYDGSDDFGGITVMSPQDVENLLRDAERAMEDKELAKRLFPDDTSYHQYSDVYWDNIRYMAEKLREVVSEAGHANCVYYYETIC